MNHPNPPTITPINPQSLTQTITPQQARHWLEHNNNHNRHLNPTTVKKYASDMREGNWQMNSMPIVFSDTGQLLDGQHRLAACVKANTPFEAIVFSGLPENTQTTIDTGRPRSLPDVLAINGEANTAILSSAARTYWLMERKSIDGIYQPDARHGTIPQFLAIIEEHPHLRQLAKEYATFKAKSNGLLTSYPYLALRLRFDEIDLSASQEFFDKLATGEDLGKGNPILVLRSTLIKYRFASEGLRNGSAYKDRHFELVATIKAWNAWRKGETLNHISVRSGALAPKIYSRTAPNLLY
jgi:hypothetical protein